MGWSGGEARLESKKGVEYCKRSNVVKADA